MLEEIESMARRSEVKVIECEQKMPPRAISELMEIDGDEPVLHLIRVRSRDGEPFGYYNSWTRGLHTPITPDKLEQNTRLELFRAQGVNITHVTQTISAVAADEELARELHTTVGAPLISLTRHSFSGKNPEVFVDYLQLYYHPDRFQYRMDLEL
jgi:GntR family transcriptional regulator